jgi:hypothetical protein
MKPAAFLLLTIGAALCGTSGSLAASRPTADLRVACIARFYHPPSDRRLSREQVYLMDLWGKRRVALTADTREKWDVNWVDRTRVIWISGKWGANELYSLQSLDLRTGKRLRLARAARSKSARLRGRRREIRKS